MFLSKTKFFFLFISFFFLPGISFASAGLGTSFSYSFSTTPQISASFSARSDTSPWSVFFNSHLNEKTISLFLDDWFINERISEHIDYFVLWGMSYGATFEDEKTIFSMGCRFGAGLDFFFLRRRIEFFTQSVWNPYFGIKKEDGDFAPLFRPVNFPCSVGIRGWL